MTSPEKRLLTSMAILLVYIAQDSSMTWERRRAITHVKDLCKLMNTSPKPASRWRTLVEWITN